MNATGWESVAPGLWVNSDCHDPSVARVRLAGELDMATAPVALQVLLDAARRSRKVVLNLASVTFLDAFAYARLLAAHTAVSVRGGELVLESLHPAVRRVFDLADIDGPFAVPSAGAAVCAAPAAKVVAILDDAIDAALRVADADMANAQLLDPTDRSLRIVSQRGFSRPFLNFFQVVEGPGSACGAAFAQGRAVWVNDVSTSPVFAGTPARDVVLDAQACAVASIPIKRGTGELVAMFSVHRHHIGQWTTEQRDALGRIARTAGEQLAII